MKTKNIQAFAKFYFLGFLLSMIFFQCTSTKNIVKLSSGEIKDMVDSSQFVFIAKRVNPMRGRSRYLTSSYDVVVKKDTLTSYLPYFGRAYQAPMDPSKAGIQFTSSDFSYIVGTKKDKQWDVVIKPNDYGDVQALRFNIFKDGSASLNITNTYRDPISFQGHIEKIKK